MISKDTHIDIFLSKELMEHIDEHINVFKKKFLWRQFMLINIKLDKSLNAHEYKIYSKTKKEFIN